MGAYFKNKGAFEGTKSCSSPESYENFLKKELGAFKKMSDVQKPRWWLENLYDQRWSEIAYFVHDFDIISNFLLKITL